MSFVTNISLPSHGRLGNQLFSFAATLGYAERYDCEAIFRDWTCVYTNSDHIQSLKFPPKLDPNIENKIKNRYHNYDHGYFEIPKKEDVDLKGYFQHYKFFPSREKLLKSLTVTDKIREIVENDYNDIIKTNPVAVFVRRGDYLKLSHLFRILDMDYYKAAMEFFDKNDNYLFFSDDINWCRENFGLKDNYFFVDKYKQKVLAENIAPYRISGSNPEAFYELFLMTLCKKFILNNSTFSWWGSFLNEEKEKVIIPKSWFVGGFSDFDISGLLLEGYKTL